MCVSPTEKAPSNSVLRSTGSSPIPSRERFITFLATGAREERRKSEGFGRTVGSCVGGTGAGVGAKAGVGAEIVADVDGDVYGVG